MQCHCSCFRTAMSAPLHATLTPGQHQALRHVPGPQPRMWLRMGALPLSVGDMRVPQWAAHLDCCEATMRILLHRFEAQGLDAVHPQRPTGFPPDPDRLLCQPRVWTVTTLVEALAAEEDIHLKPRTGCQYLKRMGAIWRRTHATVHHWQDPALMTAARTVLAGLKKSARTGIWTSFSSTKPAWPLPISHLHLAPSRRASGRPLQEPASPARERPDHPGCPRASHARAPDLVDGTPRLEGKAPSQLLAPDRAWLRGTGAQRSPGQWRHLPLPDGPTRTSRTRHPAVVLASLQPKTEQHQTHLPHARYGATLQPPAAATLTAAGEAAIRPVKAQLLSSVSSHTKCLELQSPQDHQVAGNINKIETPAVMPVPTQDLTC